MSTWFESDPAGQAGQAGLEGQPEWPLQSVVSATQARVLAVAGRLGRGSVTIQNANADGGDNVYIGNDTVTSANGLRLQPGEGITLHTSNAIYAICATSDTADVRVLEDE